MKQVNEILVAAILVITTLTPPGSFAQSSTPPDAMQKVDATVPSDGEIRKIDKETGKLTIKHGPIKHLDMPPMSMVFSAKDKTLLDKVKVGDKVRFMVIEENGKMVVTDIQAVK